MRIITGSFHFPLVTEQHLQRALTYPRVFALLRAPCQEFFCIKRSQNFSRVASEIDTKSQEQRSLCVALWTDLGVTVPHSTGQRSPSVYATHTRENKPRSNNVMYLHTEQGGTVCSPHHSQREEASSDHLSALSSDERNVHIRRYGNVILAYAWVNLNFFPPFKIDFIF